MSNTPMLSLPLLQAAQAQKHVTVNEALVRIDGLAQLVLQSTNLVTSPGLPVEGDCYAIPSGATSAWAGQDGKIAMFSNGGWLFVQPRAGWRAWVVDVSAMVRFNGGNWVIGAVAISGNGGATIQEVIEVDHVLAPGSTSVVVGAIPGDAIVFGVTGRVLQAFGGTLTGWQLGVAGSLNRYGGGLGVQAGAWLRGLTGTPTTYYAPEDLVLTAEGDDFVDGSVRLAIHLMRLSIPGA